MNNVVSLSGKKAPDTAVIHRGEVVALDDILFYADQYIHMRHIKIPTRHIKIGSDFVKSDFVKSDFVKIVGVSDLPPAVQEDEDEDTPVRAASVADTDIEEEEDWTKPLIVKDDDIEEPDFLIRLGLLDSEGIYKTVEVSSYTNLRTSYTSGLESITYDDYDEAAYPDYVGPCVLVNGDAVDASVINQDDQTLTVVVKLLTGVRVMALPRWQVIYLSMEPTGEDAPDDGDKDNLA